MATDAENEVMAIAAFRAFIAENRGLLLTVASWGDGECGYLAQVLREDLIGDRPLRSKPSTKEKIPRALRKRVLERDAYRCMTCGGHIDLCCDHIVPESIGGPTTFENLQAMCRPCNSRKGSRP